MNSKTAIYDSSNSRESSLDKLLDLYRSLDVSRVIFKKLSPNDNSKNQPYMGGHLTDLGFLPTGEILDSKSTSKKTNNPKRQVKYTTALDYYWISSEGNMYKAPNTKLIYYPQYPEVRLSGFLAKGEFDMGGWMDPNKKGRTEGRVLFLGIKKTGEIMAYLAVPDSHIAKEIQSYPSVSISGVFNEISLTKKSLPGTSKEILISELTRICSKKWITSKRLDKEGNVKNYQAQNGGGYTLEAELGVIPNGSATPDFMGWEIKQFGVKKCHLINSKPLTLMTPEPNGGFYLEQGAEAFVRKYGYISNEKPDRYDFTGRHFAGEICGKSGMTLDTIGFDAESGRIIDASGCIVLLDKKDNHILSWSFSKIMEHWKRKHAKAAYIPSLSQIAADKSRCYSYCSDIRLFTGTTFNKLLQGIANKHVYYDPGINLKNANTNPVTKRRSQFRIKSSLLENLYDAQENLDVLGL